MSAGAFHSPSWYRVAGLRPALKSQAVVRRHRYRGAVWYVVEDRASGRFNRFTPAAYQLLGLMDGRRTLDEIWALAIDQLGDDTPSQDEVIGLVSQLHAADLLQCEVSPDSAELFERYGAQNKMRKPGKLKSPFSIRIPLWDPDAFLERTLPRLKPRVAVLAAVLYVALLVYALVLAGVHWPDLTANVSDRVLTAQNLLLLWICFPLVKFLHELGHGYVTKAGGGEVHEMGIMLLVFTPIPYVDASAASGFRSKWHRVLVGAAGMLTELAIAALAMLVWAAAEPGLLRAVAFNVMLIAGVSTLVFNGNPLLRYDAYYILADVIEIPNLASRGTQYWRHLFERYVVRLPHAEPPLLTPGERRWMLVYTPASLVYRTIVLVLIVLYVASAWFFVGVVLAIWGAISMFVLPLSRLVGFLFKIPHVGGARRRAIAISGTAVVVIVAMLTLVPAPMRLVVEGVVWLPDEAHVRAGTDGFVQRVSVPSGTLVRAGQTLVESTDPVLAAETEVSAARLAELNARLDSERFDDRVKAELTREAVRREETVLARLQERSRQLVVHSKVPGRFVADRAEDLPGRFYTQGQLFGFVTQDDRQIVRFVVTQQDVDLVLNRLQYAEVRLRERVSEVYPAKIIRAVPAADDRLPSTVLSSEGGGTLAADPRDPKSGKALQRVFQFDLALPATFSGVQFGGRTYVRLVLEPEPLARQWYRRLRQLFLERFSV